MRYAVKYIYGRYEVRDSINDHVVCYAYKSEYADIVCQAMNKLFIDESMEA